MGREGARVLRNGVGGDDKARYVDSQREIKMSDHVYSVTEIVGTSKTGIGDAIENALVTAKKTLRNLEWFEVTSIRGHLADGAIGHYQVTIKLCFRYDPK